MTRSGGSARAGRAADRFGRAVRLHEELRAPSRWLWLAEGRALVELDLSLVTAPLLLTAPRGDGHAVLVLPGFLAGDLSTLPLREYLRALGYDARPWEFGRNVGGVGLRRPLSRKLVELAHETGRPVSVVGWSLGGIFARDLAAEHPHLVRRIVTLGSPITRASAASNISSFYKRVTGEGTALATLEAAEAIEGIFSRLSGHLEVPVTALYTKTDGIVDYRSCLVREGPRAENVEIALASHIGLGVNPAALWAIADRLAAPADPFVPFARGGPFALAYPRETA